MNHQLLFNVAIGRTKPENIINQQADCPFCHRESLTDIIDSEGELLLLKNKYPVIADAELTVLIESYSCSTDLTDYTPEHMHQLIKFGVKHWLAMIDSHRYKSVLFFRNHGPLSGGTIRHPHMQIIGLQAAEPQVADTSFDGIVIDRQNGVELNLSTSPLVGFSELNVITSDNSRLEQIADYIQLSAKFLLNRPQGRCQSYNLFFYLINDLIHVKIMPRFATSPLFIGYGLNILPTNLAETAQQFRKMYF